MWSFLSPGIHVSLSPCPCLSLSQPWMLAQRQWPHRCPCCKGIQSARALYRGTGKSLLSSALQNTHTHTSPRLSSGYFCLWVTNNSWWTLLKPQKEKNPHRTSCWAEETCKITAFNFLIRNTRIMHSIPLLQSCLKWTSWR